MGRRRGNRDAFVPRGKSNAEARVERITWFLLVGIFAVLSLLQDSAVDIPNWFVPLSGCIVLIGSGVVQYLRRWHVSPVTWLAGALLGGLAYVNLRVNPDRSFLGLSLIVFAGVILIGLLTGET
jgi:hypothetical protein